MTDHEQVRRDAEYEIREGEHPKGRDWADTALALLAELKQSEHEREELQGLMNEAHVTLLRCEDRLASVPALVEALRGIAEGSVHGDTVYDDWLIALTIAEESARAALTVYEQSQRKP